VLGTHIDERSPSPIAAKVSLPPSAGECVLLLLVELKPLAAENAWYDCCSV